MKRKDVFKDWNCNDEKLEFIIDTYSEILKNNSKFITKKFKEYCEKYDCTQWDLSNWVKYFHNEVEVSLFFNSVINEIVRERDKGESNGKNKT